jgi:Ca-activated chloride channel family protein
MGRRLPRAALRLGLLVAAVQEPHQDLVFPSSVELVQVVVSVTGKDGLPVRNLEAQDFVIREDGKARRIETFLRTQDAADSDRAPVELVLLLDRSSSMSGDLMRARDVIVDFAKAVPSFARGRVLTFDRDVSDRAFDARNVKAVIEQMIQLKGAAGTRIFDAVIDGAGLAPARFPDGIPSCGREPCVLPSGLPASRQRGRRVMVIFSDGDDSTSRRSIADAVRALQESEVTCYGVSYASRLASFGSGSEKYRALARDAQRTLETLAQGSGGFVIDGTAPDVVAQLTRIVDDITAMYVIGFVAAPSKKVEYRRLKVDVDHRDVTVRHRENYVAKPR